MIVERIEIVDKFLIILERDIRFRLLYILNFALVASELLFDFFDDSLVILNFLFYFSVRDAFSWISPRRLRLIA